MSSICLIVFTFLMPNTLATLESDCASLPDSSFVESSCVIVNQVLFDLIIQLFGSHTLYILQTVTFSPSVAYYDSCNHLPSYHAHTYWPQSFAVHDAIVTMPKYKWIGLHRLNLTDTTGLSGWYFVDSDGSEYGPLPPMGTLINCCQLTTKWQFRLLIVNVVQDSTLTESYRSYGIPKYPAFHHGTTD